MWESSEIIVLEYKKNSWFVRHSTSLVNFGLYWKQSALLSALLFQTMTALIQT